MEDFTFLLIESLIILLIESLIIGIFAALVIIMVWEVSAVAFGFDSMTWKQITATMGLCPLAVCVSLAIDEFLSSRR